MAGISKRKASRKESLEKNGQERWKQRKKEEKANQVYSDEMPKGNVGKRKRENIQDLGPKQQLNRIREGIATTGLSSSNFLNLYEKVGTKKELQGTVLDWKRKMVPPSLVSYAMDFIKMSYSMILSFRQILDLHDILPGKKELVKTQGEKNAYLNSRYGFETIGTGPNGKALGVVVGKVENLLEDWVKYQRNCYNKEEKNSCPRFST